MRPCASMEETKHFTINENTGYRSEGVCGEESLLGAEEYSGREGQDAPGTLRGGRLCICG